MNAKLRHMGIVVRDLKQAEIFYRKLGFVKLHPRRMVEWWGNKELKTLKMRDSHQGMIELVEGDWKPHI